MFWAYGYKVKAKKAYWRSGYINIYRIYSLPLLIPPTVGGGILDGILIRRRGSLSHQGFLGYGESYISELVI